MALELRAVRHAFGRRQALADVSLRLEPGTVHGLIGPNGAGKTTALRIALGLLRPRGGAVVVDGFDAHREPREARARVGGMLDVPGFHLRLRGRDNLLLLARLAGLDRAAARREVGALLETMGLAAVAGAAVRTYSHGMRQRLGIARALLAAPRYLLLDEPTDGLDPGGIIELRALLRRLAEKRGCGVLISSHLLHELAQACSRVTLLRAGRVLVEGATHELLASRDGRCAVRTGDDRRAAGVLAALDVAAEQQDAGGGLVARLGAGRQPAELARALVAEGIPLHELRPLRPTLEELYLDLGRSSRSVPAPGPGPVAAEGARAPRRAPGGAVRRAVRYELSRWRGARVPALLLLPSGFALLAVAARAAEADALAAEVQRGTLASTTDVTAFEATALALRTGLPALAVVLAALGSQAIAGEVGRGTLGYVLMQPLTRGHLLLGKLLAILVAAVAAYAALAAAGLGAAAWWFDFRDLTEILPGGQRYPYLPASELWPELRLALASPVLPLCAYGAIGLLAGALLRGPVGALGLGLGAVVCLDVGRGFARALDRSGGAGVRLETWLPSSHLPSPLGDTSIVGAFHRFALGESNVAWAGGAHVVLSPLCWLLATALLAWPALRARSLP